MARLCKKKFLGFLLLLCFILWLFYPRIDKERKLFEKYIPNINYSTVVDPHSLQYKGTYSKNRKYKTILLYTTHFYSNIWKGLHPDVLDDYISDAKCRIQECIITYDKRKISTADVVLFHGVDFGFKNFTSRHFHAMSASRPLYQRWLFWMHETPIYYPESEDYNNLFNWTMTFSRQSDIYNPYYSYSRFPKGEEKPKIFNHATRKDKKVAWMVGHCGMTRADYAMELQKYTDVTVYGLCGSAFDKIGGLCSRVESECLKELIRYKFYLSFENSFCGDYVTEKYYKFGLMYGLVPIVMGATYDHVNSIPGSYIDASKFSSIEELGNYINYLDSHDDAYNKYFEWTQHFVVTDGVDKMCMICQAIHNHDRRPKVYSKFNVFWSTFHLCDPYETVRERLNRQVVESKENRRKKGDTS